VCTKQGDGVQALADQVEHLGLAGGELNGKTVRDDKGAGQQIAHCALNVAVSANNGLNGEFEVGGRAVRGQYSAYTAAQEISHVAGSGGGGDQEELRVVRSLGFEELGQVVLMGATFDDNHAGG